jgi:hypothetical protein
MRRSFFSVCLFTLLVVTLFSQKAKMAMSYNLTADSHSQQNSAEIAKIVAYHKEIDLYAKQHPTAVRYFSAEDAEDGTSHWKEYRTKKEVPVLQTHASVWMKDGRVVATILSFKTDHTNNTDGSYFRADGTLAYREIHSYSIGLDPPYQESKDFYSSDGQPLSSTILCSIDDMKKTPCEEASVKDFMEGNSKQFYKKNTDLPFYNLLAKGR